MTENSNDLPGIDIIFECLFCSKGKFIFEAKKFEITRKEKNRLKSSHFRVLSKKYFENDLFKKEFFLDDSNERKEGRKKEKTPFSKNKTD